MEIGELPPDATTHFSFDQIDKVSGMTYLLMPLVSHGSEYKAKDNRPINLFLPNGNKIPRGQLIYSIRVCSMEEILQEKLITALNDSSKSQNRLAMAEVFFGAIAAFFTIVQVILFFISQ